MAKHTLLFPIFTIVGIVPYLTKLFEVSRMNELKASKSEARLVTKHKMVLSNQTLQDGILRDSHLVTLELLSLLPQFLANIFIHLLSLTLFVYPRITPRNHTSTTWLPHSVTTQVCKVRILLSFNQYKVDIKVFISDSLGGLSPTFVVSNHITWIEGWCLKLLGSIFLLLYPLENSWK